MYLVTSHHWQSLCFGSTKGLISMCWHKYLASVGNPPSKSDFLKISSGKGREGERGMGGKRKKKKSKPENAELTRIGTRRCTRAYGCTCAWHPNSHNPTTTHMQTRISSLCSHRHLHTGHTHTQSPPLVDPLNLTDTTESQNLFAKNIWPFSSWAKREIKHLPRSQTTENRRSISVQ